MINKQLRNILAQCLSDVSAIHLEPKLINDSGIVGLYSDETWSFNNGYELEVTFVAKTISDLEYIAHIRVKKPTGEEYTNNYDTESKSTAKDDLYNIFIEIGSYEYKEEII